MAKKDIHPNFKKVNIKFSNGAVLETHSTSETDIEVEISYPINHRAWNKKSEVKSIKKTKFSSISIKPSSLITNGTNPNTFAEKKASKAATQAAKPKKKK